MNLRASPFVSVNNLPHSWTPCIPDSGPRGIKTGTGVAVSNVTCRESRRFSVVSHVSDDELNRRQRYDREVRAHSRSKREKRERKEREREGKEHRAAREPHWLGTRPVYGRFTPQIVGIPSRGWTASPIHPCHRSRKETNRNDRIIIPDIRVIASSIIARFQ